MSIISKIERAVRIIGKGQPVAYMETEITPSDCVKVESQSKKQEQSFEDLLSSVRQMNLNTKTYKSVSKLPKTKGSNANITYNNARELNRILSQCKDKYETCNVFSHMGIVSLVNRK